MKNILIITPRFSPVNAADQHRVRMALSFFGDFDWRAEVLCIAPQYAGNELDEILLRTIPGDTVIHQAQALPAKLTHRFGLGSLALRSYPFLKYFGDRLLRQRTFDLIFISTTEFVLFALGVHWRRKFGIPFVVDFQDPWLSDYYEQPGSPIPPGGRLKYHFSQMLAQCLEPKVMRQVAKIVCVSPAYPRMLQNRYPYLHDDHFATIPFGASATDLEVAKQVPLSDALAGMFGRGRNWCYVGVVPESMYFALRSFFMAFALVRNKWPERFDDVKLQFVGTDYAPVGHSRKRVMPLAEEYGLSDIVVELTDRVPYFSALRLMLEADALIIPGSDDPGYTASKIYPCILARKPLLTIFHQDSSVVEVMEKTRAGVNVFFAGTSPADMESCSAQIISQWFESGLDKTPETDWKAFEPYTAREMTRRLCTVFDAAIVAMS
jgi:hypothetical protein